MTRMAPPTDKPTEQATDAAAASGQTALDAARLSQMQGRAEREAMVRGLHEGLQLVFKQLAVELNKSTEHPFTVTEKPALLSTHLGSSELRYVRFGVVLSLARPSRPRFDLFPKIAHGARDSGGTLEELHEQVLEQFSGWLRECLRGGYFRI
jgi:hypothetical protein